MRLMLSEAGIIVIERFAVNHHLGLLRALDMGVSFHVDVTPRR